MKFKTNSGFTLIELLVVVAIIGILASIVLASLGTARSKGRDAGAKGSLSSMRAEAEIMFDDTLSYSAVCDYATPSDPAELFIAAAKQVGGWDSGTNSPVAGGDYDCQSSQTSWAAHVAMLANNPMTHFCADSNGFAGGGTATSDVTISGDGSAGDPWVCVEN